MNARISTVKILKVSTSKRNYKIYSVYTAIFNVSSKSYSTENFPSSFEFR